MPRRPPSGSASKNAFLAERPADAAAVLPTEERRSLGPDLLLDSGLTWEKYKLPIMAAVALLALGFAGWSIHESQQAKNAAAASALFDAAKTDADYLKVIDTYPGSSAAANAYLLLGRAKYNAKDYAGAAQAWRDFAAKFPKHPLVPDALSGEASALEAQGKPEEARAMYQRVATSYQSSYVAPLARISEAELLLAQGKKDEAKHVYEDVIASSQNSYAGQMAEQGLKTLNALPAPGAGPVASAPAAPAAAPAVAPPAAAAPAPSLAVPGASAAPISAASAAPASAAPTPVAAPSASPTNAPTAVP